MENASKALIIAGAILLAIVIISLGLVVVNRANNTVKENSNMSEQEIQAFNAKFTSYEGDNVSGSKVNSLIQQVISTNQSIADKGDNAFICIGFPSISYDSGTNSTKMCCLSLNSKNLLRSEMEETTTTGKKAITIEKVNGKRTSIINNTSTTATSVTLSVATGATYQVKLGYIGGLVQNIAVSRN